MNEIITKILGEYQLTYDDNNNLVGGLAGLDFEWIVGALLFAISLYSLFCLLGIFIKKLM